MKHIRGHGVHSPFAYMLVTDVVRPRSIYGYYGYHDIDCADARDPHMIATSTGPVDAARLSRLLLRVTSVTNPSTAFISPSLPAILKTGIMAASANIRISRRVTPGILPDLTVVESTHPLVERLPEILSRDGSVAVITGADPAVADRIYSTLHEGLLLESRRCLLFFARAGMQKQRILI